MIPFAFYKPISNGMNVPFMASWKPLINLKEVKQAIGKVLRVSDQNQRGFIIFENKTNILTAIF